MRLTGQKRCKFRKIRTIGYWVMVMNYSIDSPDDYIDSYGQLVKKLSEAKRQAKRFKTIYPTHTIHILKPRHGYWYPKYTITKRDF